MMKKILILGKLPPPYMGPAIATSILLNSGLKEKYDLIHLDSRAHSDIHQLGKFSFKKIFRNITIYFRLYNLIRRHNPDLILIPIAQTTLGFLKDAFFIYVAALGKGKILVQLRGSGFRTWYEASGFLTRSLVRSALSRASGVIVLGDKLKYLFEPFFRSDQIYVAPNGSDYTIPSQDVDPTDETVRLLYLANLQGSKGIEDVIRAIVILKEHHPSEFTLTVAGSWRDDQTKEICIRLVEEHSLPVTFAGPMHGEKKLALLACADIFVFTPRKPEGHPWVIVESMAAGLPIISTDQGAITESVIHGTNGFIVEPTSPQQIAGRLSQLITDTELRQTMGNSSRELYLEKFTEEALVRNYSSIFDAAIS